MPGPGRSGRRHRPGSTFRYCTTWAELLSQLDSSLQASTGRTSPSGRRRPGARPAESRRAIRGDSDVIVQVVDPDGGLLMDGCRRRCRSERPPPLDLLDEWSEDVPLAGRLGRRNWVLLTTSLGGGRRAAGGRSLGKTRRVLVAAGPGSWIAPLVVVAAAAAVGVVLARQLTRRLVRLTAAAEEVTPIRRLDVDVDTDGTDEATAWLGWRSGRCSAPWPGPGRTSSGWVQDAGHRAATR